jgi:hypothetical protein
VDVILDVKGGMDWGCLEEGAGGLFGYKRDEVTGQHNLHSPVLTIAVIKSRKDWMGGTCNTNGKCGDCI